MDRLIARFFQYVSCGSESGHEKGFCLLIEQALKALGLDVWRDREGVEAFCDGWNIGARLSGEGAPILFCCHLDTVSPGMDIHPRLDGDVIRPDGATILAADDKSGIAAIIEALERLVESGKRRRTVELLFTVCEEIGLLGSKHADYSRFSAKEAVVFDSSMAGYVITKAPAHMGLHVEIMGKSSHAGIAPQKGIHALKAAAKAVDLIPCGQVDADTRINTANFLCPGKANIVPANASFDVELRCYNEAGLTAHLSAIQKTIHDACALYGATYTIRQEKHSDAFAAPAQSNILGQILEISRRIGRPLSLGATFGGSDASNLAKAGMEVVNMSTGMANVHSLEEHIAVEDLAYTASLAYELMLPIGHAAGETGR